MTKTLKKLVGFILIFLSLAATACQGLLVKGQEGEFSAMRVAAPDCSYGGRIKSIEAIDRYTVRFTLCTPDPSFSYKVAVGVFAIQSRDFLDVNKGDSAQMSQSPNGTGPYILDSWVRGKELRLKINPSYWGIPPKSKEIVFQWNPDAHSRYQALLTAQVDAVDNLTAEDTLAAQANNLIALYYRPALNTLYLGMNNTIAPFDNQDVRQALAQAVDRAAIVDKFFPKGSQVAEQFVPTLVKPGFSDGIRWYDYNPEAAKAQLQKSGFDFNQTLTLSYRGSSSPYLLNPKSIAEEVKNQLSKIGVKVVLQELASNDFQNQLNAAALPFFMNGWVGDYPDGSDWYDFQFTKATNYFGSVPPDLTLTIKQASTVADPKQRQSFYEIVNGMIKTYVPIIPIAHGYSGTAFRVDSENVVVSAYGEDFPDIGTPNDRLVYYQSDEPNSLWPGDENSKETLRPNSLLYDTLLTFNQQGTSLIPSLAESYEMNQDATVWTFYLRRDVVYTNGAHMDANDVVATFEAQWNAASPNHRGSSGAFDYFVAFFDEFLNAKK